MAEQIIRLPTPSVSTVIGTVSEIWDTAQIIDNDLLVFGDGIPQGSIGLSQFIFHSSDASNIIISSILGHATGTTDFTDAVRNNAAAFTLTEVISGLSVSLPGHGLWTGTSATEPRRGIMPSAARDALRNWVNTVGPSFGVPRGKRFTLTISDGVAKPTPAIVPVLGGTWVFSNNVWKIASKLFVFTMGEWKPWVGNTELPIANAVVTMDDIGTVAAGSKVAVSASATGDFDDIRWRWTSKLGNFNAGTFDDPTAMSTMWNVPEYAGDVNVTITVTGTALGTGTKAKADTRSVDSDSETVSVISNVRPLPPPSVSATIDDITEIVEEGDSVQLNTNVSGVWDVITFSWSGSGTFSDSKAQNPLWTAPQVTGTEDIRLELRILVWGTGIRARASTPPQQLILDETIRVTDSTTPVVLPDADVSVDVVVPPLTDDALTEGETTTVTAKATGTYDGITYAWSGSGTFSDKTVKSPVWTAPDVDSDQDVSIKCDVSVSGDGTTAKNGTTDTDSDTASIRVLNTRPDAVAPTAAIGIADTIRGGAKTLVDLTTTGGRYDGITFQWTGRGTFDPSATSKNPRYEPPNSKASRTISCLITVTGDGTNARAGSTDTTTVEKTVEVRPGTVAPTVTIDPTLPQYRAGDVVELDAGLEDDGVYDSVSYKWSADYGTADDFADSTMVSTTWTAPATASTRTVKFTLTVTATGDNTNSFLGSVDRSSATRDIRLLPGLPVGVNGSPAYNVGDAVSIDADDYFSGGVGPFTITATTIPAWLSFDSNTNIASGTAPDLPSGTDSREYALRFHLRDANNNTATADITITVNKLV